MQIKDLFAAHRDINRSIEKVISYGADREDKLKAEITEYIVTEAIEDELHDILEKMDRAMESGQTHEVGVWVSGFYGSGKSSFTKYLGLALDENIKIGDVPFLNYLSGRCSRSTTKALLKKVATRYPATVVFLSLDSESLAGADMQTVTTTLFYKALERAGFSKNRLVAQLEIKLDRDNKFSEYKAFMEELSGVSYDMLQNDALTLRALAPKAACHFYPSLFTSESSFTTDVSESIQFNNDQANEMIDLLRKRFGKEYLVFVIDEAGQYVGSQTDLILDLQGLATNLKGIGEGKVWLLCTGQQTLMEDSAAAALNSPELFKLKDRFPIAINLLANDIKEICWKRLLTKSPEGQSSLEDLYSMHGPRLQHNTKLKDAGVYSTDLDEQSFVSLYPFLPGHFDLLLNLLSQLAKSTSGIGLRSAIKVIQDVLITRHQDGACAAENSVGWLANVVTFFNGMEEDIKYGFPEKYSAYETVKSRFPKQDRHADVGKAILILQILDNMPATAENIAALMHNDIAGESLLQEVEAVLHDLESDDYVPVVEEGGSYRFLSEKLNEIQQERSRLHPRIHEMNRTLNQAVGSVFTPPPKARVGASRTETFGLKSRIEGIDHPVDGDRKEVQLIASLVQGSEYDAARSGLVQESTESDSRNTIFLIGHGSEAIQRGTEEIQRSKAIVERHRNSPDQEVQTFCRSQDQLAQKNVDELKRLLQSAFFDGSLIFRGSQQACNTLGTSIESATKAQFENAVERIFDKNSLADVHAQEKTSELFLQKNLSEITSQSDPLGLVTGTGSDRNINTDHPALVAIRDHIGVRGQVDGNSLQEFFQKPPYGWQKDTTRYLVTAMFKASAVKFKSSAQEITAPGDMALACIKTNNKFKNVQVSLRTDRIDMAVLGRAAQRLTELTGTNVPPFEQDIPVAAKSFLMDFDSRIQPLPARLEQVSCAGSQEIQDLRTIIMDLLRTDASDAPSEFGAEQSKIYASIQHANKLLDCFKDHAFLETLKQLDSFTRILSELGDNDVVRSLRSNLHPQLELVDDIRSQSDFYRADRKTDLTTALTLMSSAVPEALAQTQNAQSQDIQTAQREIQQSADWPELNIEERNQQIAAISALSRSDFTESIQGFKDAQNHTTVINTGIRRVKNEVRSLANERRELRLARERKEAEAKGVRPKRVIQLPANLSDRASLSKFIQDLTQLKEDLSSYPDIEVTILRSED